MISETYLKGNSHIHSLDPRIKILYLIFFSILFFIPLPVLKYFLLLLLIFLAGITAAGFKDMLKPVKIIMPLLILIMILTPPFSTEGQVYLSLFDRPLVTESGLLESLRLAGRFLGLTLLFYLFLRTTRIEDFVRALRFFGLSYRISLIVSLTVRYIPYLSSIYEGTLDAHRMRLTVDTPAISKWNFPARFRRLLSVLTSVLIQAVKSIPSLAMALETRGVGRKNLPGQMKKMKTLGELANELILFILILSIIVGSILL
jgi:energy-coupling factor transport system permease protein